MFIETSSEDDLGIEIQVLTCTIHKNKKNMIGVTLGGGHPKCPCIYIERVLHEGPADLDGNLKAGFEILRGWSVRQVSSVIRENETSEVAIKYKKLIIDKKSYNNLDIDLSINKLKHKFAEKFGPNISDFLGLRRAVLIHDPLISKLSYLYKLTRFYCKLILLLKKFETSSRNMIETQKEFGNSLADMAARDPQKSANEAFNQFGEAHRQIAKRGEDILSVLSESAASTKTFNTTILPDLKMTVRKYSQVKCEYLAYCVALVASGGKNS